MADPVRAQYEAYPYPQRDPKDEAKRLVTGSPSDLDEIDHYVFAGRRDWRRPFRALVAGGGTGDATVMLPQQSADRGTPAEVVESIGAPYVPSVIPAGTYQGQEEDVPTAAIGNILVTHEGVSEETKRPTSRPTKPAATAHETA